MKTITVPMKQDRRKLCNFMVLICLVLFVFVLTRMKDIYCSSPYGIPNSLLHVQLSKTGENNLLTEESKDNSIEEDEDDEGKPAIYPDKPLCHEISKRSDSCDAREDSRIHGISHTIFTSSTKQVWKIKPYARKGDNLGALRHVSEWSIEPFGRPTPNCTVNRSVPAIIFSANGYTGNMFHDFTDVIIPLFITAHQFHGQVQLLATDTKTWWLNKYKAILKQLSGYDIVNLEADRNDTIRCFPRAIIGLHFHKELGVNSSKSPTGYSVVDFKVLLRKAFGLERTSINGSVRKPKMLIISRKRSRSFVNEKEIVDMATSLGFEVAAKEADVSTDVGKFARLVNSADVLVGVHGAGLTNMVYLPAGAVVVQLVPFGGLEWLAKETFKKPIKDLELKYLEYRIRLEESTLMEQYPINHTVLTDPKSLHKKGWNAMREVYLVKQNVRPQLGRLKKTFLEALKLLSQP